MRNLYEIYFAQKKKKTSRKVFNCLRLFIENSMASTEIIMTIIINHLLFLLFTRLSSATIDLVFYSSKIDFPIAI